MSASAQRGGVRNLAIILGSASSAGRFSDAQKLLDHAFDCYEVRQIYQKGEIIENALPVKNGREQTAVIVAGADLCVLVPKGETDKPECCVELPESLSAPLEKDEIVGEARVSYKGEVIGCVPLRLRDSLTTGGFLTGITLVIRNWYRPAGADSVQKS